LHCWHLRKGQPQAAVDIVNQSRCRNLWEIASGIFEVVHRAIKISVQGSPVTPFH
jgi:hypothetical protein